MRVGRKEGVVEWEGGRMGRVGRREGGVEGWGRVEWEGGV